MARRQKKTHYSEAATLGIAIFAIAFLLAGWLVALIVIILAVGGVVAWQLYKARELRLTYERWFHNNRGIDNIERMSPLQLEVFVSELFSRLGYETRLTQRSGDQGVDVLAIKDGERYAIQVKQVAKPVGSPVIQTLTGSMVHVRARYGVCVSPSGFTNEARKTAHSQNITLLDKHDLAAMMKKAAAQPQE